MSHKSKKLPALHCSKPKATFEKDRVKIEDLFMGNVKSRHTHKDYRCQEEFSQIKAANFLSRIGIVDSPRVIFAVADQVSQATVCEDKENEPFQCQSQHKKHNSYRSDRSRMTEERQQAVNLAKWMDEKLKKFKSKKSITFMDILQYKQTILNYALGRIIDSLTKKCKEEGQILSLIWDNTFTMFEGVFNILVDAHTLKEQEKIRDEKELHEVFENNHNFLREQNRVLQEQSQAIFANMKNVILWNKKLRSERKHLHTNNRILQYRNQTYTQALQQTVEMLLLHVPESATVITAKKIVQKLAKEKHRKRHFYKKEVDCQFNQSTKEMVYKWLKTNSCLNQEMMSSLNEGPSKQQNCFMLQDFDDITEMKQVNIYDFFKLYDIGVQATAQMNNSFCQSEIKAYKEVEVMTKIIHIVENGCQTVTKPQSRQSIDDDIIQTKPGARNTKQGSRHKEISRNKSRKKTKESNKSLKNNKKANAIYYEQGKQEQRKFLHRGSNQYNPYHKLDNLSKQFVDDSVSVEKVIDANDIGEKFDGDRSDYIQDGLDDERMGGSSMTDFLENNTHTKGNTTKHLITNNSIKSLHDIPQQEGFSYNLVNGIIRKKEKRKSLAYISDRGQSKGVLKLNLKKKFAEAYKESKEFMNQNKEQFYNSIIRRRSFCGKKKVEFASNKAAQEAIQKVQEFRGRQLRMQPKINYQSSNYVCQSIESLTKNVSGPSNMAKTKTLLSSQRTFCSIITSIQQIARIPPKNKLFVNNTLSAIIKYIEGLVPDYIRQIRWEKEELICDCEKAMYPLNILLMEQMTYKYGLKDIAEKKIKNFIEKVLTFAPISEKIGLYCLLLGLQDPEVGSDELLVYLKCLVYFDCKKTIRDTGMTDSTTIDIEIVRQNLTRVLEYFFDRQYVNLIELKLQIYFQQTAPFSTVEGISILIIKELLKRKKDLKQKYHKIHEICAFGDNFFTNAYKMIKIVANYRDQATNEVEVNFNYSRQASRNIDSGQSIEALQKIRNRGNKKKKKEKEPSEKIYDISKISSIIRELLQRSDIIDQQFGKSITVQRFITAADIIGMPIFSEIQAILDYFRIKLHELKKADPLYEPFDWDDCLSLDKLAKLWVRPSVRPSLQNSESQLNNLWSLAKLYSDKIEEEVMSVMGAVGGIGLYIESSILNLNTDYKG